MTGKLCRKDTNLSEIIYYLEEMYEMGLLNDIEIDIYEHYLHNGVINTSEYLYMNNRMEKWQNKNF